MAARSGRRACFRSKAPSFPPWSSGADATSPLAKEFVRFLVAEGWLAHYLDFSAEQFLPAMSKLLDAPFWLDPGDPHQMASVMQMSSRSMANHYAYAQISGNWRHQLVTQEHVGRRQSSHRRPRASAPSRRSTRRSRDQAHPGGVKAMQRLVPALVATALLLAPLGARAADLVVWWEKGFYPQEDEAVREIIAAFEQKAGKQVELVRPAQNEMRGQSPGRGRGRTAARFPVRHGYGFFLRPVGLRGPTRRSRGRDRAVRRLVRPGRA